MKLTKLALRAAAATIANREDDFMCIAIGGRHLACIIAREQFEDTLKEHRVSLSGNLEFWGADGTFHCPIMVERANREARVMFLLFLAESGAFIS